MKKEEKDSFENTVKKEVKKAVAVGTVAVTVIGTGMARETLENHNQIRESRERDTNAVRVIDRSENDVIDLTDRSQKKDSVVETIKENKIVSYFCTGIFVISWAGIKALAKILAVFSAPIIHFLLLFAGVLLAIVIGIKLKYPEIPLKKILSKKTFKSVFIFTAVLFAASTLLEVFVPDVKKYVHVFELFAGTTFSLFIISSVKPKKKKEKQETVSVIDMPDGTKFTF